MLLTGAMTIVKPGSSAQLSIALIIVLFNMLLELKLAPYADEADDWLAFLTNIQMLLTIQGGLLLMTDDSSAPTYDKRFMGITLVVVNSFGFVAFFCGLLVLHPSIRTRITDAKKKRSGLSGCSVIMRNHFLLRTSNSLLKKKELKQEEQEMGCGIQRLFRRC